VSAHKNKPGMVRYRVGDFIFLKIATRYIIFHRVGIGCSLGWYRVGEILDCDPVDYTLLTRYRL
jgi:hypothetical protein